MSYRGTDEYGRPLTAEDALKSAIDRLEKRVSLLEARVHGLAYGRTDWVEAMPAKDTVKRSG